MRVAQYRLCDTDLLRLYRLCFLDRSAAAGIVVIIGFVFIQVGVIVFTLSH